MTLLDAGLTYCATIRDKKTLTIGRFWKYISLGRFVVFQVSSPPVAEVRLKEIDAI
jgi:hypothetical protein